MSASDWLLAQFPTAYKGYAVELGAVDGVYLSNTLALEDRGWKVLCIEPNPRHHEALTKNRKLVMRCACDREPRIKAQLHEVDHILGSTYSALRFDHPKWGVPVQGIKTDYETTVLTLDQCLMCVGFPRVDVLSLDVDGLEDAILEGFDLSRWKPKAIVTEEIFLNGGIARQIPGYREVLREGPDIHYLREEA